MKKIATIGIIMGLLISIVGCGDDKKLSTDDGIKEIHINEIKVEEIEVEEIITEHIITYEDVSNTW